MSKPYEERFHGDVCLRPPPSPRHEEICRRLHERISTTLTTNSIMRLNAPRTKVPLSYDTDVCPDLSMLTAANHKLFLVAEVVGSEDHRWDTVTKKSLYEEMRIPRLWMVDPRYGNVEVYHGGEHGLVLKQSLAVHDVLSDPLLRGFQYDMSELFKA